MSASAEPSEAGPTRVRVVVGTVGRPHGIHGDANIHVRTDEPDRRFRDGGRLFVGEPVGDWLTIERVREHSGRLVLRFAGIGNRDEASGLRGAVLEAEVDADESPSGPDEFFDRTLIGLRVESGLDGRLVGEVSAVIHLPGNDLLQVARADREDLLVPFVAAIVTAVEPDLGRVVVHLPAGLGEESGT